MKVQCLLQKFTSCCIARDLRMLHIKMFIGNAVQEIIQTNKNGKFADHVQIKLPRIPGVPGCSLVIKRNIVRRSCSKPFEVEPKY